jgi:bifunctional non-homologous end joining protein LigD
MLPRLEPMFARTGPLPPDEERWAFEVKWDGVRAIGQASEGALRLTSRNGNDITPRYPELQGVAAALAPHAAVLDGEVVAFDEDGRPSFQRLQGRMHLTSEMQVRRLAQSEPVTYMIFDLLWLNGLSLLELPYTERRRALARLELDGDHWHTPTYHVGDGGRLLELTRDRGLEGVLAKRLDSTYIPGRRTLSWVKVKNVRRTEVVIGGWSPGEGARAASLGALLVGYQEDGELRYAGKVGSGFTDAELQRLGGLLFPRERPTSPFTGARQPPRGSHFVEPDLVCTVEYAHWTQARTLRAPTYKGLRDDIDPADVVYSEE